MHADRKLNLTSPGPTGQPRRGQRVNKAPPHDACPPQRLTLLLPRARRIVLTAGQLILRNGGVVRDVANWGVFSLPKPIARAQQRHTKGHYFVMRFDSSPAIQGNVYRSLQLDPRVIRSTSGRLGDGKLESTSKFGEIFWESAFKRQ